jgi:lysophospholipase L1-like esterase
MPRWLAAFLLVPAPPRPMAHPDRRIAEASRHMARPAGKTKPASLASLSSLLSLASLRARRRGGELAAELTRRRFVPAEPRRREVAAVLSLLFVAALLSMTGPIAGAGATRPTPSGDMAVTDTTPTPTESADETSADETVGPLTTESPEPTTDISSTPSPWPTLVPTPKPNPLPTKKPAATPTVRTFVALGDSLTAWPDTPWPSRLDASDSKLKLVNNAGVPGNTTAQMRARMDSDVYAYNPDVLFVLGGTNDLGMGVSASATIANLRAIVVGAKAHKITVILLTIPPESYSGSADKIDSLNAAIVYLARAQRITNVDIHNPLSNANGVYYPKYTIGDGLHLSDLGAQVVANTIHARVKLLGM